MGAVAKGNTKATEIAFDRVIESVMEIDECRYPSDVVFVPADLAEFGPVMLRALRKEKPVVVIYPDGRERLIPSPGAAAVQSA